MGSGFEDNLESIADEARKRWHAARAQAVATAQADYERGRQVYADAIRTGRNVLARTPQEVRALGGAANALVRSTGNAVSLGTADNLEAGTEALFGLGGAGDFGQRYHKQLDLQHAADRQAAQDHPFATGAGDVLGTVGGILAADAPAAAGVVARLFPGGAKTLEAIQGAKRIGFIPEGLGTMAAVGGGTVGGATQLATDAAQGRQTSLGDFAGAVGGGALGGLGAVRRGPVIGAALGGAATAAFQGDNLDDAMRQATASAYGGRVLGTLGEQISSALPRTAKGTLGEYLSYAKSWARGEPIPWVATPSDQVSQALPRSLGDAGPQQRIKLPGGGVTIADWITNNGRAIESKFGVSAGLTRNQKRAIPALGDVYLPDHWLPSDIGDFSGGWFAPTVTQSSADDGSSP
jgi:hypothetical protein